MKNNPLNEAYEQFEMGAIEKYEYIDKAHRFNKSLHYISQRLQKTDISKIEISDKNLLFTTRRDNIKLCFNGVDRRGVPFDVLNFGDYEIEDEQLLFRLLDNTAVVLDVGANLGWHSLVISKRLPGSTVYSFEPIPENYKYLVTNLCLNSANNVTSYNFGLSDQSGQFDFHYFPEGSVLASQHNLIGCSKSKKLQCKLETMDSFFEESKVKKVDFIKVDVEGAELHVVKGGIATIQEYKPILMLELLEKWSVQFGYHPDEVINLLKDLGYSCFRSKEGTLEPCDQYHEDKTERLNFWFLHPERHSNQIRECSYNISGTTCKVTKETPL